jgi:nucleoid-associated protein YgaU
MAVYKTTSRYELSDDGRSANRKPQDLVGYAVYTSRDGDTFALLASQFLGDSTRYWEIADINPQIEWPDRIPAGTVLRIPV